MYDAPHTKMSYLSSVETNRDWNAISNSRKTALHKDAQGRLKWNWKHIWRRNIVKPPWAELTEGWELFSLAKQRLERICLLSINWFGLNIRGRTELFRLKESVGTRSGSNRLWIYLRWNLEKVFQPQLWSSRNRWKKDKTQRYYYA